MHNSLASFEKNFPSLSSIEILAERFGAFLNSLNYFGRDICPIKGISVRTNEEFLSSEITYESTKIMFQMHCLFEEPQRDTARVSCILLQPTIGTAKLMIGSFDFDKFGSVDLVNFEREKDLKIDQAACAITLHFLQIALQLNGQFLKSINNSD